MHRAGHQHRGAAALQEGECGRAPPLLRWRRCAACAQWLPLAAEPQVAPKARRQEGEDGGEGNHRRERTDSEAARVAHPAQP